ncbi:MAG: ABC transporter permease [Bacteroidia bacterium]|nr:ABC transporter permease [Bacteroidia bacterium]
MRRIFKYTFYDGLRSRWTLMYFLFFLLSATGLLGFSGSLSKAIVNLMQITIIITPMVSTVFSVMYYYHSRDFIELLLAQPLKRTDIFLGQFFGMSVSLAAGFFLGVFIPFTVYGLLVSGEVWNFLALILSGVMLTMIYSAVAFCIALLNENRVKGFGLAILFWLYTAVIYDGLILLFFVAFSEYPLETPAVVLTLLNPIDLSRVFILLQLDISALMGYTGAVINSFFGETSGMILSMTAMLAWFLIPLFYFIRRVRRTDF